MHVYFIFVFRLRTTWKAKVTHYTSQKNLSKFTLSRGFYRLGGLSSSVIVDTNMSPYTILCDKQRILFCHAELFTTFTIINTKQLNSSCYTYGSYSSHRFFQVYHHVLYAHLRRDCFFFFFFILHTFFSHLCSLMHTTY